MNCFGKHSNTPGCSLCANEDSCIKYSSTLVKYIPLESRTVPALKVIFKEQEYELEKPHHLRTIGEVNIDCKIIGCVACYFKEQCENYQKGGRYFVSSSVLLESAFGKEKLNDVVNIEEVSIQGPDKRDELIEKMELVEAKIEEFYRFIHEKDQEELKKQQAEVVYDEEKVYHMGIEMPIEEEPARGKRRDTGTIDDLAAMNEILWDRFIDKFSSNEEDKLKNERLQIQKQKKKREQKLKEDYDKLTKRAKEEEGGLNYSFKYAQILVAIDWYELREGLKPDYILMNQDLYNRIFIFFPIKENFIIHNVPILIATIEDFRLLKVMED